MARDSYKPVPSGLREILSSPAMSKASVDVAKKLAGNAQAVGHGKYVGAPASVIAGWRNERRAGAVASETVPHGKDWEEAILLRSVAAMAKRVRR